MLVNLMNPRVENRVGIVPEAEVTAYAVIPFVFDSSTVANKL